MVTHHTDAKNDAGARESASVACFAPDWRGLVPIRGRVCGGAKWVYCFLSRREGAGGSWLPKATNPLLNSLKNGSPLGAPWRVGLVSMTGGSRKR